MAKKYRITESQYKEVLNHLSINESEMVSDKKEITEEAKSVEELRAKEQKEYDDMVDPKDEVKKKEIYDKYDKLITPLL